MKMNRVCLSKLLLTRDICSAIAITSVSQHSAKKSIAPKEWKCMDNNFFGNYNFNELRVMS
jgi:hypothetical protein